MRRAISLVGSLQVCPGRDGDCKEENTETVLFIDTGSAFCPAISTYVLNCYILSLRLFLIAGCEICSVEGTTQGDPIVMEIYAIAGNIFVVDCLRNCDKFS